MKLASIHGDGSSQAFSFQDLLQIVDVIRGSSQFSEVRVRAGDLEIDLRRGAASGAAQGGAQLPASGLSTVPAVEADRGTTSMQPLSTALPSRPELPSASPASAGALVVEAPRRPTRSFSPGAVTVDAPMVGTFYRAPEPGAAPFVSVGQLVEPDTIVCIIEVMKLMTSQPAGVRGEVVEILVQDGQSVEHGQPLIVIRPAA